MEKEEILDKKELAKTKEIKIETFKKKNIFQKMKSKWETFSKRRKILILTFVTLIIIAIIFLFYIFIIMKNEQKIVVVKDNFIYEDGKLKLLDENDREIGTYECVNKDPNLCYVAFEEIDDDFDIEKTVYENGELLKTRSKIYENKFVFIYDNVKKDADKIILYNIKSNKKENEYFGVKSYLKNKINYLVLKNDKKKTALYTVSKKLEEAIGFEYDYLGMLLNKKKDKIIVAKKDGDWMLLDFNNEEISSRFTDEIKNYNDNYIVLKTSSGKYRVVEYKSIEIFKDLDYVELEEEIALVVLNNKLNIVNYQNFPLISQPIELENNNYVKIIELNDKNKIKQIKQAFSYETDDKLITIITYNDSKETKYSYNLIEGKNNINYKYYNYFDGALYLYSDANKSTLVGKYSCTNSNVIEKIDSKLTNCYPALDKSNDLTIPTFYNRFIFIYDASEDDIIKVNLYDIKLNKVLGNYVEVNSGNGTTELKNIEEDYYVVATNKNEKQGLLKIMTGKVTKAVDFAYDELIKINNVYLKAKKEDKYVIVNYSGIEDDEAFVGNYYRAKNDKGLYDVYSLENKKILKNSYAYIKLYENFLAASTETDMLYIYDYNGTKLVNENIPISSSTEFSITFENDQVFIKTKNITYEYNMSTIPWSLPQIPTPTE